MVDIKYSQNLYRNEENLKRIINSIGINNCDTVIDIGAGKGLITKELVKHCKNVIAYELDLKYFEILTDQFKQNPNVVLKQEDFLKCVLPKKEYKVFANIPFSLTSDIINKITQSSSKLKEAYLFVQKEAAQRYIGKPMHTQISAILSSTYDLTIVETFDRIDFRPIPNVEVVLLRVVRKENPEVDFILFRDFITYVFNQRNSNVLDTFKKLFTFNQLKYIKKDLGKSNYIIPSDIPSEYYLDIFKYFKGNGIDYINKVKGYYIMHIDQHKGREKVNRTRYHT